LKAGRHKPGDPASRGVIACCLLLGAVTSQGPVSLQDAYSLLKPQTPRYKKAENPSGLKGRVLCGYQGWFRAKGDGTGLGFHHYERNGKFEPGSCTIDLWPDLTGFGSGEKFATPFKHTDGQKAYVFSSIHPKTVDRHFKWMREFEIDGVFVQRFALLAAKPHTSFELLKADNLKLSLCRDSANRHGRAYALMYDLTDLQDEDFSRLAKDWKELRTRMKLGSDSNDRAYLQFRGKPLLAIWGVGFNRDYSLTETEGFIRLVKASGMSVMLGVPYYWRKLRGDATNDPRLHQLIKMADVISPWAVGRYRGPEQVLKWVAMHQRSDKEWCEREKVSYLPVLFPGFSWRNLYPEKPVESSIPRRGGEFLWEQFVATRAAGNDSAYIAMFDEIDEATAIFKCTNNPPVGASVFQTYEGLPSDHYLWLTQQGRRLLRGGLPLRKK